MALSHQVRHVQGQSGLFKDAATQARARLIESTLNRQAQELHEQQTQIFRFKGATSEDSGVGPFQVAKMACQHNDVPSLRRLFKLNQRAVSNDATLRRQLLDPYALGPKGRNCVHIACAFSSFDILDLLLSDAMQANQMAIRAQQQRVLVSRGGVAIDDGDMFQKVVNQMDLSGQTPLHLVCQHSIINLKSIGLLLDRGADPNVRTSRGETALYFAAKNGNVQAVSELASVMEVAEVSAVLKSGGDLLFEVVRALERRI